MRMMPSSTASARDKEVSGPVGSPRGVDTPENLSHHRSEKPLWHDKALVSDDGVSAPRCLSGPAVTMYETPLSFASLAPPDRVGYGQTLATQKGDQDGRASVR